MDIKVKTKALLRLDQVLKRIPVSKSTWWAGVKTGRFPAPHRMGNRCTMWLSSDIDRLIDTLTGSTDRDDWDD